MEEKTDVFCLEFALKSFQSDMLEKRREGLLHIEDVIHATQLRAGAGIYSSSGFPGWGNQVVAPKSSRFVTEHYLSDWLIRNRLLDLIFDQRTTKYASRNS